MERGQELTALIARQPVLPDGPEATDWMAAIESASFAALRSGTSDDLAPLLADAARRWPSHAGLAWLSALLLREAQTHEPALVAAERALHLAPDDPAARALLAQLRTETGRTAAAAFAAARALAPGDAALIIGHAGALAAEGEAEAAMTLMARSLRERPGWIEGHDYRATLHRLTGAVGPDDAGFAEAVRTEPHNVALRLAWFHWLAKARRWDEARAICDDAVRHCGDSPALEMTRLYLEAESGAATDRPDLFDKLADRADPGLSLARVRHALRCSAPDKAVAIAMTHLPTPAARLFWPYLSIGWRLLGDDRAAWLDQPDRFIRSADLGLDARELAMLADLLRSLHTAAAPYPDQSVRGGTQTDRPLLFRHEPIMQRTRAAIEAAVRDYIAVLPPPEAGHPLLDIPRDRVKFAGSWSVRLSAQGYHAAHTHPTGWISSALHVSLPDKMEGGSLSFGTPPPELGLDLAPYGEVEPKAGQLILFPSTLWHGTTPFADGERLSIAFDIRPPA